MLYTSDYARGPNTGDDTPFPIVILDLQKVQTTAISDVKVDSDGDFIPDNLGQTFTIVGAVTSVNLQANSADLGIYIQGATGGIFVFANDDDSSSFAMGTLLQITGTVDQYNGLTELTVENSAQNIINLGTGTVPAPMVVSIA